jgi:hypothetical protein
MQWEGLDLLATRTRILGRQWVRSGGAILWQAGVVGLQTFIRKFELQPRISCGQREQPRGKHYWGLFRDSE